MTYIPNRNAVSIANSTSTLLTAGSTFTGTWEDVTNYRSLTIAVKTDQNGTYSIQFSPDGVNQDSTLTRYYRTTQIEPPHRFTVTRKYARVVFTNTSASDQTYLRLQTIYGAQADLNAPMDSALAQDFDATVVRPTNYTEEVALGRRQGAATWNKFGYNAAVGTSAEVIASWSTAFQFITAGETISIVSTSGNDITSSGTGARSVVVYGVDQNWDEQIEVIQLNGTTPVVTTSQWIGINRVSIYLAGSGRKNAGNINITASSSGYTMAQVPTGASTTEQCIFYVPQNHQFLATYLRLSAIKSSGGGSPTLNFNGYVYSAISNAIYDVFRGDLDTSTREHIEMRTTEPFVVGEKSILWFEATGSSASCSVKGRFSGKLIKDVDA